ncbi:hypothetical protein [Xanthomarina spongicola]|uniref:Uncharacterized protein n=1 Tax=Xanthomarina spongicola TaxID=570520 RepID=A0A316DH61_9FLAO|nr:hypothetical protein [Xanthomarina spongicola]PWK16978.1 hypothetical protein LX78_02905 [Xanthomarina spongicola]
MKNTLYFLFGILILSCVNKTDSQKVTELAINSKTKSIEIIYTDSREKTIEGLKKIWNCEFPLISKSQINFNGKISNDITIMISDFKPIDSKQKEYKIELTSDLIKKSIRNYKMFSELKIITSYIESDGERSTSSKTLKMNKI